MPAAERGPLVILGVDAGDPELIQQWIREGLLPGMASIATRGCWGTTGGVEMMSEHGLWVSLLSGVSRGSHGYYYFRQLSGTGYDIRNVTGADIVTPPFWSALAGSDRRVLIVDVPDGYLIPALAGAQVVNWAVHNPLAPPATAPRALLREVESAGGRHSPIDEDWNSSVEDDRRLYGLLLDRVQRKGALCRHLLTREHFDVAVIVFAESHTGGHQFWQYRSGAVASERRNAGRDMTNAIRDIYCAIDREISGIVALLPDNANIVIVSSVGLRDQFPTHGLIESFCRQLGYQASPRGSGGPGRPVDRIKAAIPAEWRLAVSRYFPRAMRERIVADQFRYGTDWPRTTAFALPSTYTSHIRVNLRGREPEGIVEPGGDYVDVMDRIERDLLLLVDPETGRCPVKRVIRAVDGFGGCPPTSLPDMFVEWQPCARFLERVSHPLGVFAQERPEFFRGSDHSTSGWFAGAGPGIAGRGALGEIPLLALAPTFLSLLGAAAPDATVEAPLKGVTG